MIGLSPHAKQRDDEGGDEGRKAEDEKAEGGGGVCGYSGVQTGKSKGIGWGDLIGGIREMRQQGELEKRNTTYLDPVPYWGNRKQGPVTPVEPTNTN